MNDSVAKTRVMIIGPVPPPYFGVATATKAILTSNSVTESFDLFHVDTSDRRGLSNFGRFDLGNIVLGLRHLAKVAYYGTSKRPQLAYLTLSRNNWGFFRDAVLVLASRLCRIKVVCHLRHSVYAEFLDNSNWFMRQIIRRTVRSCARVLVLGESLRAMALHLDPLANVMVVPNGCEDFTQGRHVAPIPRATKRRVVFMSSLCVYKGLRIVLESISRISPDPEKVEFIFAGHWISADEQQTLLSLVSEKNISPVVHFVGTVSGEAKTKLLLSSDILVLPSYGEGHPWAIVEAMCAGLAVIASNTGAISETVDDGGTGFVVPVGDVESFTQRLTMLLNDDDLCRTMGAAGRERYKRLFTMQRSHELLNTAFSEVAR